MSNRPTSRLDNPIPDEKSVRDKIKSKAIYLASLKGVIDPETGKPSAAYKSRLEYAERALETAQVTVDRLRQEATDTPNLIAKCEGELNVLRGKLKLALSAKQLKALAAMKKKAKELEDQLTTPVTEGE